MLDRRAGVCQDFAHLAVGCLRSLGLPARYVSGYLETAPPPGPGRLVGADASHAWASVFAGTGWLTSIRPTTGSSTIATSTVASGRDYADVPPLKGVIFTDSGRERDARRGGRHAARRRVGETMRSFSCPTCRHLVFFESFGCLNCGTQLGYARAERTLVAVDALARARCANATSADCNWVPAGRTGRSADCCALTRTRPADAAPAGLAAFARVEAAKRRLVLQLDELGLPTHGVLFDLLSSAEEPVTTGHADGVVTIDLAEGDDPHREALRVQLAEPYRTLLGHLRHEIGHYYWTVLVAGRDGWSRSGRCSATSAPTTPPRCERHYERRRRRPAGADRASAPTPPRIRGRTGPRRSRTTCTSRTRCRPPAPSGWPSTARTRSPRARSPRPRASWTPRASPRSSTPGCRSPTR